MEKFPLKGGRSIVTPASNSTSYQSVTKKQVRMLIKFKKKKWFHIYNELIRTNTNHPSSIYTTGLSEKRNDENLFAFLRCDLFAPSMNHIIAIINNNDND